MQRARIADHERHSGDRPLVLRAKPWRRFTTRPSRLQLVVVGYLVKVKGLENIAASPFIDIIIQLLPIILQLLAGCNPPAPAALEAQKPGLLSRFQLRKLIRQQLVGDDTDTLALREHLFNACVYAGKQVTTEDIEAVLAG